MNWRVINRIRDLFKPVKTENPGIAGCSSTTQRRYHSLGGIRLGKFRANTARQAEIPRRGLER